MRYQPYNHLRKILLDKTLKIWYNIMIKYNWEKILQTTQGNAGQILQIIHMLTYNVKIPQNHKDPIFKYYGQSFEGYSFLVNPKKLLLERKNYTNRECAEYIGTASYRNYMHYKTTGDTSLALIELPFLEDIFNNNRLLTMEKGILYFKFEDANNNEKNNGNTI